jgi:hypothetical protein
MTVRRKAFAMPKPGRLDSLTRPGAGAHPGAMVLPPALVVIAVIVLTLAGCEAPGPPPGSIVQSLRATGALSAAPVRASEEATEACTQAYRDSPPRKAGEPWRPPPRPAACAGLTGTEHGAAFDRYAKKSMKRVLERGRESQKIFQAQNEWRRAAAEPLMDKAGKAWFACLHRAVGVMALASAEPATVVVEAAFGSCVAVEQEYGAQYAIAKTGFNEGYGAEVVAGVAAKIGRTLLPEVIAVRAAAASAAPPQRTPAPAIKLPRESDI